MNPQDKAQYILARIDDLAARMQSAIDNALQDNIKQIRQIRQTAARNIKRNSKRANAVLEFETYERVPGALLNNLEKAINGVDTLEKLLEEVEVLAHQHALPFPPPTDLPSGSP